MTVGALGLSWERDLQLAEAEGLYELYHAAFAPMAVRSAVRQLLRRDEFLETMTDPRIEKLVARTEEGTALGLVILTAHLDSFPWISPEFFAAHYPEHTARNAVYYVAFSLTHPHARRLGIHVAMLDALTERFTEERAVCVYDVCAHNNLTIRWAERLRDHVSSSVEGIWSVLDTQTFYGFSFIEPRSAGGA